MTYACGHKILISEYSFRLLTEKTKEKIKSMTCPNCRKNHKFNLLIENVQIINGASK